jgi:hypothetical protein
MKIALIAEMEMKKMEQTIEQWKTELEFEYESARFGRRYSMRPLPAGHRANDARLGLPAARRSGAGRHVDEGVFQALEPDWQGSVRG